ncbi:MAG TPA: hypothetical protein DIV41_05850 [Ruminococcaceae bacterium]|nr:hypothetical protein [Oscillospiraceae bacterium]
MKDRLKNFTKVQKRIAVIVTVTAVAAAGTVGTVFAVQKKNSSESTTSYREYTVKKGNVTVGTTESGTVSLDQKSITFPIDCEVGTYLVKSGTTVKKGDALVSLNLDSISENSSETKQKLEAAKVTLQQALNDQNIKLETAKITYESSKALAESAPVTKELTESELQNNISTAQATLDKDKKDLAAYTELQKSWKSDYEKLQQLKTWMDNAETSKSNYETQLSKYKEDNDTVISEYDKLKSAAESAREEYLAAKANADDENDYSEEKDAYDDAKSAVDTYYSGVAASIVTEENNLEDKVAEYTASYTNYTSAYNDFKDTYDKKYDVTDTELDDKVTSLKASVQTDEYNLKKAQKTAQISSASADTKEATDLNTAAGAQSTYDLTVNQLSQAVSSAQADCDTLQEKIDEINNAMNGNGVITSPCDGIVSSVSYTDGSDVTANEAIMTISKADTVSMDVSVSEDDITNVSVGQDADITLSAYDGQTISGMVESITAEPARSGSSSVSYTVTVKAAADSSSIGTVYEGMSGEATIVQGEAKSVIYVSNKAITFNNGVSTVLVKKSDGSNTQKTVTTGFSDGTYVEITGGLSEGDTVLAESAVKS